MSVGREPCKHDCEYCNPKSSAELMAERRDNWLTAHRLLTESDMEFQPGDVTDLAAFLSTPQDIGD